jgi:hypothetical protein
VRLENIYELYRVSNTALLVDVGDVAFKGADCDAKRIRDLLAPQSLDKAKGNFSFARRDFEALAIPFLIGRSVFFPAARWRKGAHL